MRITLIILTLTALIHISCRKETTSFDGPSLEEIYSDFKVLENFKASKDSVSFGLNENVLFTASFNKIVNWTITIKGQTSGAIKLLNGQSRVINQAWDGSTTIFPMFKEEPCAVTLTLENITDTFKLNLFTKSIKVNEGFLIADFEEGLKTGWKPFIQSGADMDFKVKNDSIAPQGGKYLNMAGTVNWDWLIGLVDFPASAYGSSKTFSLSPNANNVYFNFLVYGVPNTNPTKVLFQFKEDENADGNINANNDDQYDYELDVNWAGWKLITIKYADLTHLVNGAPASPNGNKQHNPDKLGTISLLHLANPSNGFASCKIDYLIFTSSPLKP